MNLKTTIGTLFKEAIAMNPRPFPWKKAIGAGIAMSFPIMVGLFFNKLEYGMLAGLGGFTFLYSFDIPYAQLAKKLFAVLLGMVVMSLLGSFFAPFPPLLVITMGLIAMIATYIFGALNLIGPSAIFFVLVFAITSSMPIAPEEAFIRAGLLFLGGLFSIFIAMFPMPFNPHYPENRAVKNVYLTLKKLMESVGTPHFTEQKVQMISALRAAEETLAAGYIPWYPTEHFTRLRYLTLHANSLFITLYEDFANEKSPLPTEQIAAVDKVLHYLNTKGVKGKDIAWERLNLPTQELALERNPLLTLSEKLAQFEAILTLPIEKLPPIGSPKRPSLLETLLRPLDRNSLLFITSLKFGLVVMFAAFVAYKFDFVRSYWIPLSCVAVMAGSSTIATLNRGIQRSIGTLIGVLIATAILYFHPSGLILAGLIFLFTALVELCIVRNYGLAVIFITPNALLIAETITGGAAHFTYFATARLIDIFIGAGIGTLGIFFTSRKTASSRIPRIMMRTIRNLSQLALILFSEKDAKSPQKLDLRLSKLRTNMANLHALYDAMLGEIPAKPQLIEYYWPIIFSLQRLVFLLERAAEEEMNALPVLPESAQAHLLYLFETLANAAAYLESIREKSVPHIPGFIGIEQEIQALQKAFHSTQKEKRHSQPNEG